MRNTLKKIKIKVTSTTGNREDSSTLPCQGNKTHGIPWSRSLVTYFTNFARCLHYNCLEAKVNTISRVARGQRMIKLLVHQKKQMFLSILASVANFNVHESKIGTQKYMYGTADISTNCDS